MPRKPRVLFPGALYHVCSRGDRQEPIFSTDNDRLMFLDLLGQAAQEYDLLFLAYCLMGNHYHLVMQTRQANLSDTMRYINGVYTQRYNNRNATCGHVFQGRFHANLIALDAYMIEACRYVELNPVRAKLVRDPHEWEWSSYRAHVGLAICPPWLAHTLSDEEASAASRQARHLDIVSSAKL